MEPVEPRMARVFWNILIIVEEEEARGKWETGNCVVRT